MRIVIFILGCVAIQAYSATAWKDAEWMMWIGVLWALIGDIAEMNRNVKE